MVLFLLSLFAGVLTVLAPCTISLLPIIVGGTVSGGTSYKRALVVTTSLGVSIILFTFVLKVSTLFLNIPQSVWQDISGVIILFLGTAMIFPALWDKIPLLNQINQTSNKVIGTGYMKQNVFGDILIGVALGPVFSSCSPTYFLILAEVLPRSLFEGLIYLIAYAFGLCASLLVIAVAGQKLLAKAGVASDPKGTLKRAIGVLFLLLGVVIILGYDKKLELVVANHIFDVTTVERSLLSKDNALTEGVGVAKSATSTGTQAQKDIAPKTPLREKERIITKASQYSLSPEITNPSGFVNTNGQPISISQFKGKKVVLVDFWTYSCINCQRTLPYMKAWYDKYHDQGLEIVSIHTPEFGFEKVQKNVERAVKEDGVQYPVVLDNDYGTWNAFSNQYWPRKYLVDIDGYVVYDHAGEGDYDVTEKAIQKALKERVDVLGATSTITGMSKPVDTIAVNPSKVISQETYFGGARNEYLGNGEVGRKGEQTFIIPEDMKSNMLYLGGSWNFTDEYAETGLGKSEIKYAYNAKDVYFVASSKNGVYLTVTLDGKPLGAFAGDDVDKNGRVLVKEDRLYKIIHGTDYGQHLLKIEVEGQGLDAYTFTFG
jgi:cytochrome c biogenesis protein CcdA/thiol-disulfide isomerase/thioredoxin